MSARFFASALLATAVGAVPPAAAQTGPAPRQGLVVHGRVSAAESRWDETNVLYTYVTIDVARVVGGGAAPAQLVLKQLGGETGGVGLWVPGQASFVADETVLLLLDARPIDGSLLTANAAHGKWRVESDADGQTWAIQSSVDGVTRELASEVEARLIAATTSLAAYRPVPAEFVRSRGTGPRFAYLPTDGGYPARWHEVDDDAIVHVDRAPFPSTWSHATQSQFDAAVGLWRGSGMELDLRVGSASIGTGVCPALSFTGNGRIAVAFNDPCGGAVNEWVIGGGYYTTGDLRTVGGVEFQKFLQGFVVLDNVGPQSTAAGCFQDALTHGLGHAMGLGHTSSADAVMRAEPPPACSAAPRGLGGDDRTGITSIYRGLPTAAAPPATPTTFAVSAALSTVTMSWTPATTGGAPQRFVVEAGTSPGVYNVGSYTFNAPATTTTVGAVPAGTYYVRLRAANALGSSAPTAERSVTVGACTPPSAPTAFSASASDTAVTLQWTAPTSGVVQGYRIEAGSGPGQANLAVLPRPVSPTTFATAAPYGTYYVRVAATNVCGASPPSNEVTLTVAPCSAAPMAPTGLTASVAGRVVTLGWAGPTGVAPSGYTVIAGSAPGGSDVAVAPTGNTATSLVASAAPGTYYVRVAATNACGQSAASNEVAVVVQ